MARFKKLFDDDGFENIVNEAMKDFVDKEMRSFRRTVATWKNKPKFFRTETEDGYGVSTDNELWFWINYGTKPRTIYPKGYHSGGSDYIQYPGKFEPKTRPGKIQARQAQGKYGSINRWPKGQGVPYPGIEARRWDEEIAKQSEKRFQDSMLKMLDKILEGS